MVFINHHNSLVYLLGIQYHSKFYRMLHWRNLGEKRRRGGRGNDRRRIKWEN